MSVAESKVSASAVKWRGATLTCPAYGTLVRYYEWPQVSVIETNTNQAWTRDRT